MMDPEPRRCRRTDGNKWRCRRQVVPDYKYCKLHVHRGCQGSRKLVEDSEKISQSGTAITPKIKQRSKPISAKIANAMDAKLSTSIPATQEFITKTKSLNTNYVPFTGTDKTSSTPFASSNSRTNDIGAGNCGSYVGLTLTSDKQVNIKTEISDASATPMDPIGTTYANPTFDRSESNNVESKNASYNKIDKKTVVHGSSRGYNGRDIPFGLSPTSVLQDGKVLASNIIENDLWRCKRTDGKKWRCRYNVIPDQKYCERHMHRGAKKSHVVSEPVTIAVVAPPLAIPRQVDDSTNLEH